MERTEKIPVFGMTCGHCVKAVTMALQDVAGVSEVAVSLEDAQAQVKYDDSMTSLENLKSAIIAEGYSIAPAAESDQHENAGAGSSAPEVTSQTVPATFSIQGMSCVNCALAIEKGLKGFPGIIKATVNFPLERLIVEKKPELADENIIAKVSDIGYEAVVITGAGRRHNYVQNRRHELC